jgi:phenylpropionate dioxygenase-like ring-hydroxylating dioxygenase large terminal subunit
MSVPQTKPPWRQYRDVTPASDIPATRTTGLDPSFWYPVARSRDLKPGKTLAVKFAGTEIVLVRPKTGKPYALEDRCAHRQVPLSMGVVKNERLQCGYHCWTYDRTGACVSIPYLNRDRTLPNGVRGYACREAYGFVFVFPGDQELAEVAAVPELPYYGDRRFKVRVLDREIACHYSFMHENLMDMNHQFLHRKQMGQMKARSVGRSRGDDWVEVNYTFAREEGKQPIGEALVFSQKRGTKPDDNNKDVMTIRTEYPYQTLRIRTKDQTMVMDLWIAYVPLDAEQRTNRTFGLLSIRRPKIPGILDAAWPLLVWFTERIFKEDRWIVEREQEAHDRQGADHNHEVFPVILELRSLLTECGAPVREPATERRVHMIQPISD